MESEYVTRAELQQMLEAMYVSGVNGNPPLHDYGTVFYATTTQSIANGTSANPVSSYTKVYDSGQNFNPTTGVFTVREPGLYLFLAAPGVTDVAYTTSPPARLDCTIQVDGAQLAHGHGTATVTNADPTANAFLLVPLIPGQEVWMEVSNNTGGTESLNRSFFAGFMLPIRLKQYEQI